MSKRAKTILIVGVVGVALWYLVTQTKRFDIGAASVSKIKLEDSGIRLNVKLPIINRSDFPVPVSGFLGRLLYNGSEIGSLSQVAPVTLAPRSVGIPEFTTVISYVGLATGTPLLALLNTLAEKVLGTSLPGIPNAEILDASTLTKMLSAMRVVGTVYVGGVGIDINQPLMA